MGKNDKKKTDAAPSKWLKKQLPLSYAGHREKHLRALRDLHISCAMLCEAAIIQLERGA